MGEPLDERVAKLEVHQEHVSKSLDSLSADMKAVLSKLDKQQGGIKVMSALAAAISGGMLFVAKKLGIV